MRIPGRADLRAGRLYLGRIGYVLDGGDGAAPQ
jgi:hypothetical protein